MAIGKTEFPLSRSGGTGRKCRDSLGRSIRSRGCRSGCWPSLILIRQLKYPAGIALVCGAISGNLEVLDFDFDAENVFWQWQESLPFRIQAEMTAVRTGGGGYHVIYRCDRICRCTKIAMTLEQQVIIESRGEGGYVVAAGSPAAVHSSGQLYQQIQGDPLPAIPTITPADRKLMWEAAAAFDQQPQRTFEEYVKQAAKRRQPKTFSDYCSDNTPWRDFDRRGDWGAIVGAAGWTSIDGINWLHPAAKSKLSAAVRTSEKTGDEVLVVFSTNAGPLAPIGATPAPLESLKHLTALFFGGDRSAAAKTLIQKGFGQ